MKNKSTSLKKIFVKKMSCSAIVQIFFLIFFLFLSKKYIGRYQDSEIRNNLLINDSFSQDEIAKYILLKNANALDLSLLNISQERKLDSIKFIHPKNMDVIKEKCLYTGYVGKLCHKKNNLFLGITPIKHNNDILGFLITEKQYKSLYSLPTTNGLKFIIVTVIFICIFNSMFLLFSMRRMIYRDTCFLIDFIQKIPEKSQPKLSIFKIKEYKDIALKFIKEHKKIIQLQQDKLYYETKKEIAEQVAHDIRSPIAAINIAISTLKDIPENQKYLIQNASKRINDIANNLLLKSNKISFELDSPASSQPVLLSRMIIDIVSEKQLEYLNSEINIVLNIPKNTYQCYSLANEIQLGRILSNMINNSIESFNESGSVNISLQLNSEFSYIIIEDNGCGIPENIMPKIMQYGFSHNKVNGAGFGLFYARKYINQINGSIDISSKEGIGTKIIIKLPRINVNTEL